MSEALLKTLGLPEDADEQKMLDAVAALRSKADKADKQERKLDKNPVKTLEQQARDQGLVLLDSAKVTELVQQAAAGAEAKRELHQAKFDAAFDAALSDARGARVTPAERDTLAHFYELDSPATLKLIEERQPIVAAKPKGVLALEVDETADPAQVAAAGISPQSLELDQKIRKHLRDQNLPHTGANYVKVLDQWTSGELVL